MGEAKAKALADVEQLRTAVSAIHEHLHAGNADEARKACVAVLAGEAPKVVAISRAAALEVFMHRFTALAQSTGLPACAVVFVPGDTPDKFSLRIGGRADACKQLQSMLKRPAAPEAKPEGLLIVPPHVRGLPR